MIKYLFIIILIIPIGVSGQKQFDVLTNIEGYMIVRYKPELYSFLGEATSNLEFFTDISSLQNYLELENAYQFYLFFDINHFPPQEAQSRSLYSFRELNSNTKGEDFLKYIYQDKYESERIQFRADYDSISIWKYFNEANANVDKCASKIILVYKVKLSVIEGEKLKKEVGFCDIKEDRERKKGYKCPYYYNGSFQELKFLYKVIY